VVIPNAAARNATMANVSRVGIWMGRPVLMISARRTSLVGMENVLADTRNVTKRRAVTQGTALVKKITREVSMTKFIGAVRVDWRAPPI